MATLPRSPVRVGALLRGQGALIALALLVVFAALRYDGFLGLYNIGSFFRYNAMFMLLGIGMTFVIITGGIDLSVGSVVSALVSPHGALLGLLAGVAAGTLVGVLNGLLITRLKVEPFLVTLGTFEAARGAAQFFAHDQAVPVDLNGSFVRLGQGDLLGLPVPVVFLLLALVVAAVLLRATRFGRTALFAGDNEDAARLMGLRVDRVKLAVYTLSGLLAGLAGVLLAAQSGGGQPNEGVGWELTAIAGVVVGGTLLSGGRGSVFHTMVGIVLLGLIFNILNFENGRGFITIDEFWQNVLRGAFLLVVVLAQSHSQRRRRAA